MSIAPESARKLDIVRRRIEDVLMDLSDCFVPGAKLTFIMRVPGKDESVLIITDDAMDELRKLIDRRAK